MLRCLLAFQGLCRFTGFMFYCVTQWLLTLSVKYVPHVHKQSVCLYTYMGFWIGYKLRNLTSFRRINWMCTGNPLEESCSSLGPPLNCTNQTLQPPHHLGQHCDFIFFVKPGLQEQDTGPVHIFINTPPSRHCIIWITWISIFIAIKGICGS